MPEMCVTCDAHEILDYLPDPWVTVICFNSPLWLCESALAMISNLQACWSTLQEQLGPHAVAEL